MERTGAVAVGHGRVAGELAGAVRVLASAGVVTRGGRFRGQPP
jgi:hypothetical protein